MAADQAADVAELPVVVVPTRTIPQGMAAMLAFNEASSLEENKAVMTQAAEDIISGSVTHAIRDTQIDGITIADGDVLGMIDGKIVVSNPDMYTTCIETMTRMATDDTEILTLIIGEDGSMKEAEKMAEAMQAKFADVEVEIHEGQQPVYPYLFAAE